MGYRSDVALVVNKDIYVEAMKEALKNPAEPQYHMLVDSKGEVVVNEIRVEGNYAVLYWEYVKWDDSYEDVSSLRTCVIIIIHILSALENLMKMLRLSLTEMMAICIPALIYIAVLIYA